MQLDPRGFEFLLKLRDPRNILRLDRGVSVLLAIRLIEEADQHELLALTEDGLYDDAERTSPAIVVCPATATTVRACS